MRDFDQNLEPFVINKTVIKPGENKKIKLNVGNLPSGDRIFVRIRVFRSKNPGPVVLVLAGVHGDEINGVEIVRRSLEKKYYDHLNRGTVIVIPLLNVFGFINFSREVPDGKDINRSFPGSTSGSLASRVARSLTKHILPIVDFGLDFHTGGRSHYNYPQIRYSVKDEEAKKLAGVFGAPYILAKRPIEKSLRRSAYNKGKPIIVYEGGENLRFDGFSIERGLAGLKRVLQTYGMIDGTPSKLEADPLYFNKTTWLRAKKAGVFHWTRCSGNFVSKGERIGLINGPYGKEGLIIHAPRDAYIVGHNNSPVVNAGDALFHLTVSNDS